jgi:hypothetical protein
MSVDELRALLDHYVRCLNKRSIDELALIIADGRIARGRDSPGLSDRLLCREMGTKRTRRVLRPDAHLR